MQTATCMLQECWTLPRRRPEQFCGGGPTVGPAVAATPLADCTLKATRSHTTCRVALPGAQPTAEARQAPGSRPSLA